MDNFTRHVGIVIWCRRHEVPVSALKVAGLHRLLPTREPLDLFCCLLWIRVVGLDVPTVRRISDVQNVRLPDRFCPRVCLHLVVAPAARHIFAFASIYEVSKQKNKEINEVIVITFKFLKVYMKIR
jgi:hypothetical protein